MDIHKTIVALTLLVISANANAYHWESPYAYCNNNPVNCVDPDGKKVQLVIRDLNSFVPKCIAAHSFVMVTSGNQKTTYTYGPSGIFFGTLQRTSYSFDDNIRQGKESNVNYDIIDVPIPDGMTEKEFDNNVEKSAKMFEGNNEIKYNILAPFENTGNCNTSSTSLLYNAGVTLETLKDLKEKINGNAYGFGELRPWTEEERKSLEE